MPKFLCNSDSSLAIYTVMESGSYSTNHRHIALQMIDSLVKNAAIGSHPEVVHGGFGVVYDALNAETLRQVPLLSLLTLVISLLLLALITNNLPWTLLCGLTIILANITVFGLMAVFEIPVTMVCMAIPPLIMVVGVANFIHLFMHAENPENENNRKENYLAMLAKVGAPIRFNTLTTAIGFLSLAVASMQVIRVYGIFAATGVSVVLLYSFILTTFLKSGYKVQNRGFKTKTEKIVAEIIRFSMKNYRRIQVIALIGAIIALAGITRITIDTHSFDFLPKNNPVLRSHRILDQKLGHYMPLDFIVSMKERNWKDKKFLAPLAEFQDSLIRDTLIGSAWSIANAVSDLYSIQTGAQLSLPATIGRMSQRQILLAGSKIQEHDTFKNLVGNDGKDIRLTLTGPVLSAAELTLKAGSVVAMGERILGSEAKILASGYLPLYAGIIDALLKDQLRSISLALMVILIMLGLLLRSWKMLLVAAPSNLIPILFVLGIMGYTGIKLDTATVTIAAAVLGIIVDDTIHMLYNYRKFKSLHQSLDSWPDFIAKTTGRAIVHTSVILVLGFTVIGLSGIHALSMTGLLIALAIALALISDLLILPALLKLSEKPGLQNVRMNKFR
jgi:hypothetical protein